MQAEKDLRGARRPRPAEWAGPMRSATLQSGALYPTCCAPGSEPTTCAVVIKYPERSEACWVQGKPHEIATEGKTLFCNCRRCSEHGLPNFNHSCLVCVHQVLRHAHHRRRRLDRRRFHRNSRRRAGVCAGCGCCRRHLHHPLHLLPVVGLLQVELALGLLSNPDGKQWRGSMSAQRSGVHCAGQRQQRQQCSALACTASA